MIMFALCVNAVSVGLALWIELPESGLPIASPRLAPASLALALAGLARAFDWASPA